MIVISRELAGSPDRRSFEDELIRLARERADRDVVVAPHVYHVPEHAALWDRLARTDGPVAVAAWMHPRPVEWLLRRHGVGGAGLHTVNMAACGSPAQCLDALNRATDESDEAGVAELECDAAPRWYPVIDLDRCVNCKQCMQFCLFGVYALDADGVVYAAEPDNCKDGCPACARVCPRGAIIFPLCDRDDAIAGAPGRFPQPDDEAKRMFEQRTKRPHAGRDELDDLIDDLEDLTRKDP